MSDAEPRTSPVVEQLKQGAEVTARLLTIADQQDCIRRAPDRWDDNRPDRHAPRPAAHWSRDERPDLLCDDPLDHGLVQSYDWMAHLPQRRPEDVSEREAIAARHKPIRRPVAPDPPGK